MSWRELQVLRAPACRVEEGFSKGGHLPQDMKDRTETVWQEVEGCSRGREQHVQGARVLKGTKALNLTGHDSCLNTHAHFWL